MSGSAQAQQAQATWNEAEVIRLARERAPDARIAEASAALAEAREESAGLYPDPALAWEREALLGGSALSQDRLVVTVPVDVSGRRHAQRLLARTASAAARAEAAELRADAVEGAVLWFYEALAAEERARLLAEAVADLNEAARVLSRREEVGTVAGYERDRLELETELARSRASEAEAEMHALRLALVQLLAPELGEAPQLSGSLETRMLEGDSGAGRPTELVERALQTRPMVREAAAALRAAERAAEHTGRAWLPRVDISGGLEIARDQETEFGYVAGLAVELPVISRGRELRVEAQGARKMSAARLAAGEQRVRAEVTQARLRLEAAIAELGRFDQATGERAMILRRAVTSGYQEGRRTIVELLDAQRVGTEIRLRRLELAVAAKRAEIRLRRTLGALQ